MSSVDDICVVTQPLSGASEPHVRALLEILDAITSVSLVTIHLPPESTIRGDYKVVDVSSLGTGSSILTAAVRFLRNQFRMALMLWRRDEELVLFFGATAYLLPIIAAKLSGKTVVLEPRGNVSESLYQVWSNDYPNLVSFLASKVVWAFERLGYRLADRVITLSPGMAEDLKLEKYEDKLYRYGAWHIDLNRFRPETPYEQRGQCIGYVGRLGEEKGIKDLIPIIKALPDDVTFVFIGDGDLRSWVVSELQEEINDGCVEITGWIKPNQVPDQLNRLRLLVMTSRTEGLPITILEAMACGTPAYAKPVAGVPDIVIPGKTGYLLERESPTETATRIQAILEEGSVEMSNRCRSFVEERYSFDAAVNRYREAMSG